MTRVSSKPQVSVIVPIYNVAPWLPMCLDSLLGQTLSEWEAILVDDGSRDGSAEIADAYVAKDKRFKVIHQKNTGLGGARNAGCKLACGEYLCFLDSDDLLSKAALQGMVRAAEQADADMVVADFHTFTDGKEETDMLHDYPATAHFLKVFGPYPAVFTWAAMRGNFDLLYFSTYFCVAWGKLFRRSLWNKLGCESPGNLRMAEDFIAVKKFMFAARRITAYSQAVVLYRKRAGSATSKRTRKAFEVFRAYNYASQMFRDAGVYDEQYSNIHAFFLQMFMDHMLWFTPYKDWIGFYRRAQKIIAAWDITPMEPALQERVRRYQRRPSIVLAGMFLRHMRFLIKQAFVKV